MRYVLLACAWLVACGGADVEVVTADQSDEARDGPADAAPSPARPEEHDQPDAAPAALPETGTVEAPSAIEPVGRYACGTRSAVPGEAVLVATLVLRDDATFRASFLQSSTRGGRNTRASGSWTVEETPTGPRLELVLSSGETAVWQGDAHFLTHHPRGSFNPTLYRLDGQTWRGHWQGSELLLPELRVRLPRTTDATPAPCVSLS